MIEAPPPAASTVVVLVAEDEPLVRGVAIETLSDAGFLAVEARHADDALDILAAQNERVHVLFTDVHMPGAMDGLALAHHTRRHWPWIAVLVASGCARPKRHEIPAGTRFLAKPYSLGAMVRHIRELVAASA